MTSEELARLCFAARPILWAIAIIIVLLVASVLVPKIFGPTPSTGAEENS